MSRLYITPREQHLISDLTKELTKDVVGQKIFYYPVSEHKTALHGVYNEAVDKVFDAPVEIDALVDQPQRETKIDRFGLDRTFTLNAYIHYKDVVDKGVKIAEGDYFQYGDVFYEITSANLMHSIYGQVENVDGILLSAVKVRQGLVNFALKGPTLQEYSDHDAVQTTYVQQRGQTENRLGPTADVRDLQKNGVLDAPLDGPKEVSPRGDTDSSGPTNAGSSFYDE
jgi:hypothetical protein